MTESNIGEIDIYKYGVLSEKITTGPAYYLLHNIQTFFKNKTIDEVYDLLTIEKNGTELVNYLSKKMNNIYGLKNNPNLVSKGFKPIGFEIYYKNPSDLWIIGFYNPESDIDIDVIIQNYNNSLNSGTGTDIFTLSMPSILPKSTVVSTIPKFTPIVTPTPEITKEQPKSKPYEGYFSFLNPFSFFNPEPTIIIPSPTIITNSTVEKKMNH